MMVSRNDLDGVDYCLMSRLLVPAVQFQPQIYQFNLAREDPADGPLWVTSDTVQSISCLPHNSRIGHRKETCKGCCQEIAAH